jgi:hypothetical protein
VLTSSVLGSGDLLLQWNAVVGEGYIVQYKPNLFSPSWTTVGFLRATTPLATFEVPPGGFYRVQQVTAPPTLRPTLRIRLAGNNQVRISWLNDFLGFALQSSPSLLNPVWTDVTSAVPPVVPPVTVEGNEFVVYETIGPNFKFYRLFQ